MSEETLLLHLIKRAAMDARNGWQDAVSYFNSDLYQEHLELLDLPGDLLPKGLEKNGEKTE